MLLLIKLTIFFATVTEIAADVPCNQRYYGPDRIVCVCNSTYCDTLASVEKVPQPQYVSYTTNKAGLRLQKSINSFNSIDTPELYINSTVIKLNKQLKYQTIIGFGGAVSDSAALNIFSLDEDNRKHILRSYFSKDGIECNTARVPMAATDFSTHPYSYDDGDPDPELKNFQLAPEDLDYKIPIIKYAKALTEDQLYLFGSLWTAPKWMKTNGQYNGTGFIKTDMLGPYAQYFHKFLEAYLQHDLPFWGITTGNEPFSVFTFPELNSVGWLPDSLASWIENHLGPTLRKSSIESIRETQLLVLDDQRLYLPWVVDMILANKGANKYVDGIAVHWYTDNIVPTTILNWTHYNHTDKYILSTEASIMKNVTLGSWDNAVLYIIDIIADLQNWITGWTEWNIALNLDGGPTYINNFLDASIIVNATGEEFYKQPTFYVFGHFSKFLTRGSIRINSTVSNTIVKAVAFQRPDNGTAVLIYNPLDLEIPIQIQDDDYGTIYEIVSANSITTLLYW